jgi:hypothetical protein
MRAIALLSGHAYVEVDAGEERALAGRLKLER